VSRVYDKPPSEKQQILETQMEIDKEGGREELK
jgi:hypothetical protein